jgi:ketosteroid isomerase-like protein
MGDSAKATNEVGAVLQSYLEALARKDGAAVYAHLAPELVQYSLAPPLRQPPAGVSQAALQGWLDSFEGDLRCEARDAQIVAGEDVAFCHCLNHLVATRKGGQPVDLWFRGTMGLRKIDGVWKITHQHESVPFLMDGSGLAALDLRP